jgi:hypothetical protein
MSSKFDIPLEKQAYHILWHILEEKKRKWQHSSNQNSDCLKTTQPLTLFCQHTSGTQPLTLFCQHTTGTLDGWWTSWISSQQQQKPTRIARESTPASATSAYPSRQYQHPPARRCSVSFQRRCLQFFSTLKDYLFITFLQICPVF